MNSMQGGRIFTVGEVAMKLRLSQSNVYRLVQEGTLPSFRIGRSIRVHEKDLATLCEPNRRERRQEASACAS